MTNPIFPERYRINAAAQYLQRPFFVEAVPADQIEAYSENLTLSNAMLDHSIGITTVGVVTANAKAASDKVPLIIDIGDRLSAMIADLLRTLGPLAGNEIAGMLSRTTAGLARRGVVPGTPYLTPDTNTGRFERV